MKKSLSFLLLLFTFQVPAFAQLDKVEQAFTKAAEEGFSGVVVLSEGGEVVFEKAAGYREFESGTPLLISDIFEMASITKQFTAMMVMMCQEKGLLDYGDLADQYLDIPYKGVSIRQLLSHTNGLPDYQAVMDQHWDKSKVAGNEDILEYLRKFHPPMLAQPGEKYEYSNTGYVFLASIVEKVTGRDFIELSREWIFEPLGLSNTDIRTLEEKAMVKNFAAGHSLDEKGIYINANKFHSSDYTVWLGNRKGPGRISSNVHDLLNWDSALKANRIVSGMTLDQAFSPTLLNDGSLSYYGFGWDVDKYPQLGKTVSHTGSNPGYRNLIVRALDKDITFIMLNNNEHPSREALERSIIEAMANW
ncbi:serine hydrolase domain-containing protein [Fontibacter flavus]|uniref:Serine hydrolase domain-containing protein n=1 Tax=Fontibacter flavus TaxID=654838 RepID=A0ABV6FWF8_9BACT